MEPVTKLMEKRILYIGNKLSSKKNPTTHGALAKILKSEGFIVYSASHLTNKYLRLGHMVWMFFRKFPRIDVVLIDVYSTQNFWYAMTLARLCKAFSKDYIPVLHGGDLKNRFSASPAATKKLLGNATGIVSPSLYLKAEVEKLSYQNVHYIPNPVFLENYDFKKRLDIRPNLLWVRAFDEIYNPLLALQTLEILIREFPTASLCMIGPDKDGSLKSCREYAEKHKLPVQFTGKLQRKEWIALAGEYDLFLNTTNIDNMPVSLIEAMALGLPVIATNVGGIPYLIEDGKTGVLVSKNDDSEMAAAVKVLLKNPGKAREIARNARERAEEFDWKLIKMNWRKLLS